MARTQALGADSSVRLHEAEFVACAPSLLQLVANHEQVVEAKTGRRGSTCASHQRLCIQFARQVAPRPYAVRRVRKRDADALPLRVRRGGSRPAHRPVFPVITALMPKRTSALAITSLVTGILGWSFLPFVGSIVAIITGHMARAEIRRNWDSIDGYGLALVGLCLGWAAIILSVLAVLMVLLVFGGLAALLAGALASA